jgi:hypothetical protein
MQYQSMTDPDDVKGCTATIIKSIEAHWATANQEIFIAAVVLNPFYQEHAICPSFQLLEFRIHAQLYLVTLL